MSIQCLLGARHCAEGFLSNISFNPSNNPIKHVPHVAEEGTETQRGEVTCSRAHSGGVPELALEPRSV